MVQYVGSNNNIIDVDTDETGISVTVYTGGGDGLVEDVAVTAAGIPELVEVILEGPDGETPAERIVRFAAMFDATAGTLVPAPVGALRLVLAFLHRAAGHRDYETWSLEDCQAVAQLLADIGTWAGVVRPHLT